jgi:hypothetical protein
MNRTLIEKARCMLSGVGFGKEFWAEAVGIACYLVNRSPSSALGDKTPQEVWTGKEPSLTHIKVFGCDAYVHVPKENRSKLDKKPKKCIFIGYKDGLKGYKLWNPKTKKVVYSRDVVFREIKDVVKQEVLPSKEEPKKIEFDLKDDEADSTEEHESVCLVRFFLPVSKLTSIRFMLSIAVAFDFEIEQMDVKTTFMHGDLEEEILMKQP